MEATDTANTLQQAILYFSEFENCRRYMVGLRWGGEEDITCPRCGSSRVKWMAKPRTWKCYEKHSQPTFTLKTGTIFEDSPIQLEKWLPAVWMIAGCKNGISSYEIHRGLGVTQKTAWFMLHRIRLAMQNESGYKLAGEVEAGETFVGGKTGNMSKARREKLKVPGHKRRSVSGKAIVSGLLNRDTREARVKVTPNVRAYHLRTNIIENVVKGSIIYSDALRSYRNVDVDGYEHEFIDHAVEYVRGRVHTNGMENFWSLLKRALKGTYVSVEPFHLQAYSDEQAFRYNHRKGNDVDRFTTVMKQIVDKRLTYKELIGKTEEAAQS